jgi:hypothetical protein
VCFNPRDSRCAGTFRACRRIQCVDLNSRAGISLAQFKLHPSTWNEEESFNLHHALALVVHEVVVGTQGHAPITTDLVLPVAAPAMKYSNCVGSRHEFLPIDPMLVAGMRWQ